MGLARASMSLRINNSELKEVIHNKLKGESTAQHVPLLRIRRRNVRTTAASRY
jgi:hypothetical protein